MAVIKCKECGKEISSTAESCPNCGYRTAHGRSVSEAKGMLVWWVIAVVCMLIGAALVLINLGEFADRIDYLDEFKYFSDEGQKAVQCFGLGVILIISGIVDVCCLWYQLMKMKNSGNNGFLSEMSTYSPMRYNVEWECKRCYITNASGATHCVRCGAAKGGVRPHIEEKIPTWKRIQIEEAEQKAKQENAKEEEKVQPGKCAFCGEPMNEGQLYCGACGQRRE